MDNPEQPIEPPRYEPPPPPPPGGPQYQPPQYQPPQYPSQPPTYGYPPPKKSSPWMWIGITCGAVALLGILCIVGFTIYAMKSPQTRQIIDQSMAAGQRMPIIQQRLEAVGQALVKYAKANNGEYPAKLDELVPKYMGNKSELTYPTDSGDQPFIYTKPKATDPGTTCVIEVSIPMGAINMRLRLLKDGTVSQQ
jgi:hypothetical protein